MTIVQENITNFSRLLPKCVKLVAVSKFKPKELLLEAYEIGFKCFGENYVQEMVEKHEQLPRDIEWHFIGHLQTNKVKYIAPFVGLIHSVDSFKLLKEINKQAKACNRTISCLIQIYIADEDTKTGMTETEFLQMVQDPSFVELKNIKLLGMMGMSTFTDNTNQIEQEFVRLKTFFEYIKTEFTSVENMAFTELSMGMSNDWSMAINQGSTLVRVGSAIFGNRN
jgi:PLP dependent protein